MKSKIGKFSISHELVHFSPEEIKKVMGECVILRAEFMYASGHFEYVAISDLFEEVPEGCMPPEYLIEVNPQGKLSANKIKGE